METDVYRLMDELAGRHWWFRGREAVIEALLGKIALPSRPRVLDAGCGTGANLQLYSRFGAAEGFDPSPDAVAYCRRRGLVNVRQGTMEEIPFEASSFELLMAIRQRPEHSSLPVVIVTSKGGEEHRQRGAREGADAYIVKDEFDQQTLLETIGRLVGR